MHVLHLGLLYVANGATMLFGSIEVSCSQWERKKEAKTVCVKLKLATDRCAEI